MSGEASPAVPSPRKCSGATLLHLERVLCLCLLSGLICQVSAQRPRKKENCANRHDNNEQCELWARQGHCDTNTWMLNKCTRSCGLCYKDLDANERFRLILDEFYDYKSREFPEYATFVGYHNYDDSLESFKMEAFDRRKNETERFLKKLTDIDTEQLSRVNKREMKIIKSCLQTFIDGYKWREYGALNSVNFLEGLANGPQWPGYTKLETVQDFERYLKRLASMPDQIEEQIMLMKRAIKLKRSSHLVSINRVPDMMSSWNVDLYFLMPFQRSLSVVNFPDTTKLHMWDKAESLMPRVTQALNRMKQFMHHDYSDSTRESPGVHSLPHGLQYYEACLKWYLGYNATAAEVFDLGLKEVSRIMEKIKEVMRSVGFEGELKSFFRHIESIPQFYNHTKEEILHKYRSLLDDLIIPRLSTLFKNVTIAPIKVIPVERDGPWGSYGLGQFYVNLKEPEKRSTFTMMPLTLHEAYPGHHFQDLYSQLFEIPAYRAQPMNGRLYSVPFHFPVYTAYSEGWALYAEFLGHELDLYRDPYELFGRYVSEIFRACRLVVDTGIHAYGWSRDKAIQFLSDYSDFPSSQIAAEVDRYITAPGQACSYKIGEIKIRNLRQKAERLLGSDFDIREFHNQVLKIGYVPLDILEEVVDEWIQAKLTNNPSVTSDYLELSTHDSGSKFLHPNYIVTCFYIVLALIQVL